jgi:hypothetical protein
MGAVAPLAAEEFLNRSDAQGKHKLLDGELISLPVAKMFHDDMGRTFEELLRTCASAATGADRGGVSP